MIKKTRGRNASIGLAKTVEDDSTHTVIDSLNDPAVAVTFCDGCGKQLARDEFVCRLVFALVDTPHATSCNVCEGCYLAMGQDRKVEQRILSVGVGRLLTIAPERGGDED